MANRNITLFEKGTQNETYPKTVIGQVEGLSTALAKAGASESSVVLNGFNFNTVDHSTLFGAYIVKNALNSPFEDNDGVLNVIKCSNGEVYETWSSDHNTAFRIYGSFNPIEKGVNYFKVNNDLVDTGILTNSYDSNGVKVTEDNIIKNGIKLVKTIHLDGSSNREYILEGALVNTRIVVDFSANKVVTLKLNGVFVKFDETNFDFSDEDNIEDVVVASEPMIYGKTDGASGELAIELVEGTKNFFYREPIIGTAKTIVHPVLGELSLDLVNNSSAVIYNEAKNGKLTIKGSGYLSIFSLLGGHAIKSKNTLVITGLPKIRATAYHDIIHGNGNKTPFKGIEFESGYVYADYCNDFFGANTADGDQKISSINVYSGEFTVIKCEETFMQADAVVIYPDVKIHYKDLGEGLWLYCKEGLTKVLNGSGLVNKFYTTDLSTEKMVLKTLVTPLDYFDENATPENIINQPISATEEYPYTGIKVYEGVILDPISGGVVTESNRTSTTAQVTVSDPGDLENEHTTADLVENVFSEEESFIYNGTAQGGIWTVGINQKILNDYKAEVNSIIKSLSSMIVPPKQIYIDSLQYTDSEGVVGEVESLLVADSPVTVYDDDNNATTIKIGEYQYGTKTFNKYSKNSSEIVSLTITLHPKEIVRIHAIIDPDNVTNNQLKWTIVGLSEKPVIGRTKEDNLEYCKVQGLDIGTEDLIVSTKALNKDYAALSYRIHFEVVEAESGEE